METTKKYTVPPFTDSELRLIHELMFMFPPSALDEARKKVIEAVGTDKHREFRWGDFLRRDATELYKSVAHKIDHKIMVAPSVIHP